MKYNEYDNFSPYKKLMDGLKNSYKGLEAGKNTIFQFLPTPMDAAWETSIDYNLYQKMDAVPAERDIYYVPGTSRISNSYINLLDTLKEADLNNNSEYVELRARLDKAFDLLKTLMAPLKVRYMDEEEITEKTFKTTKFNLWIQDCASSGDPQAMQYSEAKKREIGDNQKKMDKLTAKLEKPYLDAKNKYEEGQIEYKDSLGKVFNLPYCSIDGEINKKVGEWDKNKDDYYEMTTTMKEDRKVEGDWETMYNASFTASWFGGGASASTEITRMLGNATYEVTLKVKGIETFQINRGDWYDDNFVKPDMEFVKGSMFTPKQFFGEQGNLQQIPVSFLVIYKPTIELKIDKKMYQERIYSNLKISPLASFFGMPFSLNGGVENHRVDSPDDHVKLVFEPGANDKPKIMGVTSVKKYL